MQYNIKIVLTLLLFATIALKHHGLIAIAELLAVNQMLGVALTELNRLPEIIGASTLTVDMGLE